MSGQLSPCSECELVQCTGNSNKSRCFSFSANKKDAQQNGDSNGCGIVSRSLTVDPFVIIFIFKIVDIILKRTMFQIVDIILKRTMFEIVDIILKRTMFKIVDIIFKGQCFK